MTHKPQRRSLPRNLQKIHPTHINYSARGGRSSAVTSCQSRALRPEVRALPRGPPKYHHAVREEAKRFSDEFLFECWLLTRPAPVGGAQSAEHLELFHIRQRVYLDLKQNSQSKPVDPRGRSSCPVPADWELLDFGRSFPAKCVSGRPTGSAPSAAAVTSQLLSTAAGVGGRAAGHNQTLRSAYIQLRK